MHKIVKVCKSVCCERNCVCESHVHSNGKTWNKRTSDLLYKNPHFFVITRPNQMEFSLKCRKIVIFSLHEIILWFTHYFESYPCGKSDCNFFWDIWYIAACRESFLFSRACVFCFSPFFIHDRKCRFLEHFPRILFTKIENYATKRRGGGATVKYLVHYKVHFQFCFSPFILKMTITLIIFIIRAGPGAYSEFGQKM